MTNQEAFNAVWNHFITQGQPPSVAADMTSQGMRLRCRYRGPNGERCAAGVLIPDDMYVPGFENRTIDSVLCNSSMLAAHLHGVDNFLLTELQRAHDEEAQDSHDTFRPQPFNHYLRGRLESIADHYNLSIPE